MYRRTVIVASYVVIGLISLSLRSAVPVYAIGLAPNDDLLFVRLAYYLGGGLWLGPYDELTLAKGMAYPAFILLAFAAGIPLKIAEQGLYLAAAGLAAWLVARLTRNQWLALVLFGLLAFNPALWSIELSRVIREGTYIGLSLAVLMLAAAVLVPRVTQSLMSHIALLVTLGLVSGIFWLTREEGVWLIPALAFLIVVAGAKEVYRSVHSVGWRPTVVTVARAAGFAAIPLFVFIGILSAVAGMNYRAYGEFTINEFQSAPFRAAYGALARVQHDEWQRYIVFPKDARERAYAASPAAQELRASLESEVVQAWQRMTCEQMHIAVCPGVPAGWFVWAFRTAVADAGHYSSARDAFAFYDRLATEINDACDHGRIPCQPFRATLMPPFRWEYVGDALAKVPSLARMLVDWETVGSMPSEGPPFVLDLFADLVGPLAKKPTSHVILTMTVTAPGELPDLAVRDRKGDPVWSEEETETTKDTTASPVSRETRFELATDCVRPSCDLLVRWDGNERVFPIDQIAAGPLLAAPGIDVLVRRALKRGQSGDLPAAGEMRRNLQKRFMRGIARVYAVALPVAAAGSTLGILLAMILWRFAPPPAGVVPLAFACAIAVGTRIALLTYIDVSSFPAVNALYVSSASPILLVFVVLGLYLGIRAGVACLTARRRQPS